MLGFHRFLVLSLFELKFAELLFSDAKFTAELTYLLVIVTMSIQLTQCLFLLFLNFQKGF